MMQKPDRLVFELSFSGHFEWSGFQMPGSTRLVQFLNGKKMAAVKPSTI
jgi:hypothetical protein